MTPFRALHRPGQPLLLPNAWDYASAALLARQGYPAIGTTSLGVAAAAGLPDGTGATRAETLRLAERITKLPVLITVDIEGGFSDDPAEVARTARELAGFGVAGINLEDAMGPAGLHQDKIRAVKAAAPGLFVNARTDTHWLRDGTTAEAAERAAAYIEAGADGIFVPGLREDIPVLAGLGVPLNVLYSGQADLAGLAELGVARVSTGSALYRAALDALSALGADFAGRPRPAPLTYEMIQDL
ncbi:isocitrate lyase/PEP mutase family protein [Longispora albida]|uniref:isocitrate lyase/PEP mutase family protein n=1 Tax=Longispora albida TaxID=203523 RepID=UPI000364B8B6|nr:isocitrate lyase/phosphoenolpyruvate mutase family protein [Longispora albida]